MGNIEKKDQEVGYDYYQRLKQEYELVLKDLGEKYHISLDDYKGELDSLQTQLSIDEFIDVAEKKAEELRSGKEKYKEFKNELLEKFEDIKELIDSLMPEIKAIKKELLKNPSAWSEQTKKYLVAKGREQSSKKIQQVLGNIEKGLIKILKPLGKFGDWLLYIFQSLLKNADVTLK